jgi:KipI family sensor histidine kinase inhibitor
VTTTRARRAGVTIDALGDQALLVRFGDHIDAELNRRVHALVEAIRADPPAWLGDIVPAYASLALFVDPTRCALLQDPLETATAWVRARIEAMSATRPPAAGTCVEIAVRYGGVDGPDLADVAAACGLPVDDVVARHVAVEYRVAMLGFSPGFPYLLGLDPMLAMPRLATPRRRVEAGSVAIGGAQTGIYPRPGPGGWRVIGRTDAVLFDPARSPPSLLQPGDRVRFVAT